MKTKVFFYLTLFILFSSSGCEMRDPSKSEVKKHIIDKDFEVVIIDSCEYIVFDRNYNGGSSSGISHKQNCKNCINK